MRLVKLIIIIILINVIYGTELHTCPDIENDPHVKIFRIPEKLDCNNLKLTGEVYKVNEYSLNQNTYETESFLISIAKLICTTEFKIFHGYTTIKDIEYITLSYTEYLKINKTLSYVTHDKIISLIATDNANIYQNKDSGYKCEYNIFSTNIITNYEITLHRNKLYERTGMMKSPIIPVYSCTYSNKICHINNNVLVWDANTDYDKTYVESKTNLTMFLLKDTVSNIYHMISEEFKIAYTILNMSDIIIDSTCDKCIKTDNPLIGIKIERVKDINIRVKRNVHQFNQYNNIEFGIFYNRIDNICTLINYNYEFWLESCRNNPILCAKTYTNASEIKAELINNYLMIYQCTPATIIAFKPRKMKDGRCSALIPIKFTNDHSNVISSGYLDTKTLEIYNNTILYEDRDGCKSRIIFRIGSLLYVYYSDTGTYTNINNIHNDTISTNPETIIPRPIPHDKLHDYIYTDMNVTNIKKINEYVYAIIAIILIIFGIAIYLASIYRNKKNYNKLNIHVTENTI